MKRKLLTILILFVFISGCSDKMQEKITTAQATLIPSVSLLPITPSPTVTLPPVTPSTSAAIPPVIPAPSVTLPPVTTSPAISEALKFTQLSMTSLEAGYALTEDYHILKTLDGGNTWTDIYQFNAKDARLMTGPVICSVNADTLYIAAYYNHQTNILSTLDGGNTWTAAVINPVLEWVKDDISAYHMSFTDVNYGYLMIDCTPGAGMMFKALYKTADSGASWTMVTGDQSALDNLDGIIPSGIAGFPNGISFSSLEKGWTVCTSYGLYGVYIYKTENGGVSWNMTDLPELPKEYKENDPSELFITALGPSFYGNNHEHGRMIMGFTTYLQGRKETAYIYILSEEDTWILKGKCNALVYDYSFFNDKDGLGLGVDGKLYKTVDGGFTWTVLE